MSKYLIILILIISSHLYANSKLCQTSLKGKNKLLIIVEGTSCYKKDVFGYYQNHSLEEFFEHFKYPKRMSLMMGVFKYSRDVYDDHDLIYIPQRRPGFSVDCIKSHINRGDYETIKVMGASWGADSAIKIVDNLVSLGHKINSLLTLDHVSKGLKVINNLVVKKHKNHRRIKEVEVDYWYNFYQKSDTRSMLVGIQGNQIQHADIDIEVNAGNKGHVSLYRNIYQDLSLRDYLIDFYAR